MLTQVLTQEDIAHLHRRFYYFHDSVIESWTVRWLEGISKSQIKVCVQAQNFADTSFEAEESWSKVVLTMEGCVLFRIVDSPIEYYRVTPNGIHIIKGQDSEPFFGVDFGHFCDPPSSIQELKESPCCVVCSRLFWEAEQTIV